MRPLALAGFLGAVALAVAASPRRADACSCSNQLLTAPADGATDVPTNAVIVVVNRSTELWYSDLGELVLSGPDGPVPAEVSVAYDAGERAELVRPLEPLAASTRYTLGDAEFEITFQTGAGEDETAPDPAEVGTLAIAHAHAAGQGTSCGDEYLDIDLSIALPADAVAAELTIRKGFVQLRHVIPAARIAVPLGGSNADCSRNFPLEGGDDVCFVVRSRDHAGNLGAPVERCATVTACADVEDPRYDLSGCEPAPPSAGCRTTTAPAPLLLLALAYAVLLAARSGRKRAAVRTR
jgi:hypothetical protein